MGDLPVETEVLVLGAGPGGYAAAFRAADLGLDVTLVSDEQRLGGVCLLRGCIPSKALLHLAELSFSAGEAAELGLTLGSPEWDLERVRGWKDDVVGRLSDGLAKLCERRGIQLIQGRGRFAGPNRLLLSDSEYSSIQFRHAIVATGSLPVVPPGLDVRPGGRVMTSTGALELADTPERLLVVGGGYVGLELGSVYAALGSRVTLVEMADRLLGGADTDLLEPLRARLDELFEDIRAQTRIEGADEGDDAVRVTLQGPDGSDEQTFERVLLAAGRRPNTDELALDEAGIETDEDGFIPVDAERRTNVPSIFAIGDLTGGMQLAHKAMHEGKVAAEVIAGRPAAFDARAVPAVIYTDPQVVWCGLAGAGAKARDRAVDIARFPWHASGRALTMGASKGLTKLVLERDTGRVLGLGAVGRGAEALVSEAVLAVEMGALAEDLALMIHPHPSLAETIGEAAERFFGMPTHLAPD
ncbi:MAG: dihydrolipoyl dehydrogenase [Thiohalocapsa sp.]|nr:dihydrolipoyl dehydrogenase [Thiohalocapsa sp.]